VITAALLVFLTVALVTASFLYNEDRKRTHELTLKHKVNSEQINQINQLAIDDLRQDNVQIKSLIKEIKTDLNGVKVSMGWSHEKP